MTKQSNRPAADNKKLRELIGNAGASGGAEISNFQPFIERLCDAMHLPKPDFAGEDRVGNDYCFERRVDHTFEDGRVTTRRIDLYRRGCFIMEAKQSAKRKKVAPQQIEMLGDEAARQSKGHARRGSAKWDRVMQAARNQAIDYARDLPVEHGYPAFILIIDVGNVIEVYADFSGQGKNYSHFPDRRSYRIGLDDLLDEEVQDRLWLIWNNPHALDPAKISAAVTKDIAERLAKIAKKLEAKYAPDAVADFLMRGLFTMFAEDVELIPKKGFENLLGRLKERPHNFVPAVESLWQNMDRGGFDAGLEDTLKKFNGALFQHARALPLEKEEIHELHVAAIRDWTDVEPAIFGTLLEQALDPSERSKLGAHFTPRAYVERLVIPTIIEPLRDDWEDVQAHAAELEDAGDHDAALEALTDYHHKLCTTRVLDPACGTGNFLYVAFELMKRLEGEVLEHLGAYSETQASLAMDTETVSPKQFYGLEINARAVPIAELVLWIGYLKWQLKTAGLSAISEPVLHAYGNIKHQDAILAYDKKELRRDEQGKPITIWDGRTTKAHPVTGKLVPDEDSRIETYTYEKPQQAKWPETEFIVGNPPFIGVRRLISRLSEGYVDAIRHAYRDVPETADYVAYWWHNSAKLASKSRIRRFGLITTSSISQAYSAPVLAKWIDGDDPKVRICYAIADHPWVDTTDGAAVRIAMTVGEKFRKNVASQILNHFETDRDQGFAIVSRINSRLKSGADLAAVVPLLNNSKICFQGVVPAGDGFKIEPDNEGSSKFELAKPYVIGRNLTGRLQTSLIIDAFGLGHDELREKYPAEYVRLKETVLPYRKNNRRKVYREKWWIFAEPRPAMRDALADIDTFIATPYTSRHRIFVRLSSVILPDAMAYAIADNKYSSLSTLSSRVHSIFSLAGGGTLEDRPRYHKTRTFDPFPFPACIIDPDADNSHFDDLGESLDAFRKGRLEGWDWLTMTRAYNALERYREAMNGGDPLTEQERDVHERAQIAILAEIHDEIDLAVLAAYGWLDLEDTLIGKPGGTTPSPCKSPEQEEAEEELLSRLVALNKERAGEEARGHVRWLRPDYQIPKLKHKVPGVDEAEQVEADLAIDQGPDKPSWPKDGLEQIRLVRDVLSIARGPVDAEAVTRAFKQQYSKKRRERIEHVLANLAELGLARQDEGGFVAAK